MEDRLRVGPKFVEVLIEGLNMMKLINMHVLYRTTLNVSINHILFENVNNINFYLSKIQMYTLISVGNS